MAQLTPTWRTKTEGETEAAIVLLEKLGKLQDLHSAEIFVNYLREGGLWGKPEVAISEKGSIISLKGYGLIKVFKRVSPNGNIECRATSNLSMNVDSNMPSCLGRLKHIIEVSSNLLVWKGISLAG